MTLSNSRLSYDDCYDLMDRAINDTRGIRFKAESYYNAIYQRNRLNYARGIDRRDNAKLYEGDPGNPLFGRSIYDTLTFTVREMKGSWWVVLFKRSIEDLEIVSLTDDWSPEPEEKEPEPLTEIVNSALRRV